MADFHLYEITIKARISVPAASDGTASVVGSPDKAASDVRTALTAALGNINSGKTPLVVGTPVFTMSAATPVSLA